MERRQHNTNRFHVIQYEANFVDSFAVGSRSVVRTLLGWRLAKGSGPGVTAAAFLAAFALLCGLHAVGVGGDVAATEGEVGRKTSSGGLERQTRRRKLPMVATFQACTPLRWEGRTWRRSREIGPLDP